MTTEDIEGYAKEYKGSELEKQDLKAAYEQAKGNMTKILDMVVLASEDDVDRFVEIIEGWIKNGWVDVMMSDFLGEVKSYAAFKKSITPKAREARRKAQAEEAEEAEQLAASMNEKDEEKNLHALIQTRRQQRMDSLISALESKYGGKGKSAKAPSEPTDEEFEAIQSRLLKKKEKSPAKSTRGRKRKRGA